ncbi:uncharacterized protein LTHEOB_8999 [Neofusicoccum parvum]|uniref:Uncharacterized protein LTHEOB_8999 n=1 Tax=Neofusicoccum parvum TaxID=310453 RepID=A0ACB5SG04_9PEZI|nr:uncharacterized protein LTHEOB_8999 [Neofusicoccum parvum]GME52643.1 uncharacterized protein LTHEOB_8999 [Neofusicoccum parvum]
MKAFSILALTAGLVAAAPTPKEQHLEKRVLDPVSAGIISGAIVTAVVGTASGVAAGSINNILPNLNTWEQVREEFTKKTVEEMWARRPDDNVAAICYNMDYTVSKPDQVSELASVKLSSGLLNTDYDCFFLKGPDARFTPNGDGGFINFAVQNNEATCTYDAGEVYCK